jgi:hypothetical protein
VLSTACLRVSWVSGELVQLSRAKPNLVGTGRTRGESSNVQAEPEPPAGAHTGEASRVRGSRVCPLRPLRRGHLLAEGDEADRFSIVGQVSPSVGLESLPSGEKTVRSNGGQQSRTAAGGCVPAGRKVTKVSRAWLRSQLRHSGN